MKAIYPVTITTRLNECKKFYQEVFGFSIVFEADWYVQLLHEVSGVEIGLMKPSLNSQPKILHGAYEGKGVIYTLEVVDAEKEFKRIKGLKTEIFHTLVTEEWGQTHFMLTDPAGVVIDVVQQAK